MATKKETVVEERAQGEMVPVPVPEEPESSALTKVEQTSTAVVQKSIEELMEEEAGGGMEGMGANDFSIPFFSILQKGSPQVDEASPKFLKFAKAGAFMNTVTQELYSGIDGLTVIPCGFKRSCVEWKDRDSGGGLVGHHAENSPVLKQCTRNAKNQLVMPNGNIIVDTAYHFALILKPDDSIEWGVMSMYSTQMKKSRDWNTVMRNVLKVSKSGKTFTAPTYSQMYKVTTKVESKDKYNWYGYVIVPIGPVTDSGIYEMARSYSQAVAENKVRLSLSNEHPDDVSPEVGGETQSGEVPF